jgi:putative FmdB family regulatory protein
VLDPGPRRFAVLPRRSDVPTYAYACTTCDHRFEVRQSFSDAAVSECPECAGTVRKLFNTVGIVFKGSGFYRTDSRGDNGKANGKGNGKAEPRGAKESDASSSTEGPSSSSASKEASGASGSGGKSAAKAAGAPPA